jgi:hypothetical protein
MEGVKAAKKGSLTLRTHADLPRMADLPMSLSHRSVAEWEPAFAPLWAPELRCSGDGFSSTPTAERDSNRCRCRSSCLSDVVPTGDVVVVLSVDRVRRRASPSVWMGTHPVLVKMGGPEGGAARRAPPRPSP